MVGHPFSGNINNAAADVMYRSGVRSTSPALGLVCLVTLQVGERLFNKVVGVDERSGGKARARILADLAVRFGSS